jgi:hypothetical protein
MLILNENCIPYDTVLVAQAKAFDASLGKDKAASLKK